MCLIERRQWLAENACRLISAGEGRRQPKGVGSPCNLCSDQGFPEVATKFLGACIEITGCPDRLDGSRDRGVSAERVSRSLCRHRDRDSQPGKNACPIQHNRTDPELPTMFSYVAGYLSRYFRGSAEKPGIDSC